MRSWSGPLLILDQGPRSTTAFIMSSLRAGTCTGTCTDSILQPNFTHILTNLSELTHIWKNYQTLTNIFKGLFWSFHFSAALNQFSFKDAGCVCSFTLFELHIFMKINWICKLSYDFIEIQNVLILQVKGKDTVDSLFRFGISHLYLIRA